MNDDFKLRAALKSDEELHNCINNREKLLPETVETAVEELQKRGTVFSEEELKVIAEDMQARRDHAISGVKSSGIFNRNDKDLQVEDPEAPSFYSKGAIFGFSILFSVLFGAIMLAINISKTQYRQKTIWVVLFGLTYVIASVLLAQNLGSTFSFILIIFGAYLLQVLFWNRYIGNSTLYRAKPIKIPLIIGLCIYIPIIILLIYEATL
jgi:uncharacterized membrane protein YdcZ (DUF606 family)